MRSGGCRFVVLGWFAAAAGCGDFEDPNIVIDLRVLAMSAEPPTQVLDVDLADATRPIVPSKVLAQLRPTQICALVADPGRDRRLVWSLAMCPLADDERCAAGTEIPIASGILDDPELALSTPQLCATAPPSGDLFTLLYNALLDDMLRGLGGVRYGVQLQVGGEGDDRALDQYAVKTVEVVPRVSPDTQPNTNPKLRQIDLGIDDRFAGTLALNVRCATDAHPLEIAPGTRIKLNPIESEGTRESYIAPTLDGSIQHFTETMTYQWTASAGGFAAGTTGGAHDLLGNEPALFNEYRAPTQDELDGPLDVSIWLVQRDERYGAAWYVECVHVIPPPATSSNEPQVTSAVGRSRRSGSPRGGSGRGATADRSWASARGGTRPSR